MTKEDKELVYRELCSRIPYGVKFLWDEHGLEGGSKVVKLYEIKVYGRIIDDYVFSGLGQPEPGYEYNCRIDDIKLYLRPMSSMTREEHAYYVYYQSRLRDGVLGTIGEYLDWLNKNMFDYSGLIERGLAIEAPEGMYK